MEFVKKSKKDDWQTPESLYRPIDKRHNIDLDPCAGEGTDIGDENIRPPKNGLKLPWYGVVWLNPPFSKKKAWIRKACAEIAVSETIYIVTPDSTDVKSWWHDGIAKICEYTFFHKGRVNYYDPKKGELTKGVSFGTAVSVAGELPEDVESWMRNNGDLVKREV